MRCRSVDLKDLYLSSNQIGDSGAQALANALPQCGLTYLSLSSNQISDSVQSELNKMHKDGSNPVTLGRILEPRCRSVDRGIVCILVQPNR